MNIEDAIELIRPHCPFAKSTWADLGCGSGLFTHALATLLPAGSTIYAVDKIMNAFVERPGFNNISIKKFELDFEKDILPFKNLDGILMANSLHFVSRKMELINKLKNSSSNAGQFIIVEYDTDMPNRWVPFPVSFLSLQNLFYSIGYSSVIKLNERPSAFNSGNLYAAIVS